MESGSSKQWAALVIELAEDIMRARGSELEPEVRRLLVEAGEASFQRGLEVLGFVVSSTVLEKALAKHADALVLSAKASNKYAARLSLTTYMLAAATIVLAIAAIAQLFPC